MGPGEGEGGIVMIKGIVGIPGGVAGKAGRTVVSVSGHTHVVIVRFRIHMTGGTGELGIVGRIQMAIRAIIPFALVFATVNREVGHVVIKGGRLPGGFSVAGDAIR